MTISILIPVYNYDLVALVESIRRGGESLPELMEVIIGDDGSSEEFSRKYSALEMDMVKVVRSEKNIGRAAIRNKMIAEAKGDYLLFIDADTMFETTVEAYIQKWLSTIPSYSPVICGGVLYHTSPPGDPEKILRWRYGRKKEQKKASDRNEHPYSTFSTFNVLIDKSVFNKLRFDEELKQYGHEDTLFAYQLKKAGIRILHIDNQLYHEGLETNMDFIHKTKLGIENLSKLYDKITDKSEFGSTVRLIRQFNVLSKFGLNILLEKIFIYNQTKMELQLSKSNPKLWLFRFYKTSMFCALRNNMTVAGEKSIDPSTQL